KEASLRYRGVRVLVVDDKQMNQFVAAEQLGLFGCNVDQALNGQEAVDAVLKNDYAVVFMDCQMPVMDGYTATRIIRERESPDKRNTIIALTAHALEGERERVVSVGMDDYLTKPLRPQTLQRALQRWIKADASTEDDTEPEALPAPEPPSNKPSLQAPDFSDCSTPLLLLFLEQVPMQLEQLDGAIAVRELDEARAYAHKLKGSLLTVGADELANVAQTAQFAAERSELESLDAQIAKLIDGFWKLERGVKKELATRGGARKAGAHG
ncbi:MAG TPA: response regulator, partial [Polyangiales bacterium]